ncbi:hypothetical protein HFP15_25145 [Amycolatopsis sp. K13G38]|uniref:Acyl-CoA dehydrogenase/oxidase C-terminal domain-containing protein n=1 Tax=Amycolatopsis acididurans TaxID=2724524 RepID=A0ABX1JCQ8_9PSEU|nr:acyl-CoA dehydrogenase family protein [Amycolatopsis acididurans]NKQ56170.1 hypothetical protein [Amycolatopsis acididurans]
MDFRYSADELEIHRYARESFRGHLPLSRLRDGHRESLGWAAVGTDGWLHACLPDGGESVDLPLLAGLAREAGAVAAGEEFVQNGWLLPRLLTRIEDSGSRKKWLAEQRERPGFLAGGAEVTLGARLGFDRYTVERTDGENATLLRVRDATTETEPVAGLSVGAARVRLRGGTTDHTPLRLPAAEDALTEAGSRVLRSAALVGLAAEILDRTVTYVSEREQFGRPVGQFQSVKHLCADVHTETQIAWLAVLYAAVGWADDPFALDHAANQAATTALAAARTGAQLHGGMGFTWESDLHWLLKAALDAQLAIGPASAAATRIGAAILETA